MDLVSTTALSVFILFVCSGIFCARLGEQTGRSRVVCGILGFVFGPFVALVILSVPPEGNRERLAAPLTVWLYALGLTMFCGLAVGSASVYWFGVTKHDVPVTNGEDPFSILAIFLANVLYFVVGMIVGGNGGMLIAGWLAARSRR